jgi:hypothetical protein
MMLFRLNAAVQVPIRLLDGSGNPVTGVLTSDIRGGICTIVNADGTKTDITLSGGNFTEFSPATKTSGLYHISVPINTFSVIGPVQWAVLPAASVFSSAGYVGTGTVEDLPTLVCNYLINSDGASPVHSLAAAARLITQFLTGNVKQDAGANTMTIYKEDTTTALSVRNTFDASGFPASDPIYKVSP